MNKIIAVIFILFVIISCTSKENVSELLEGKLTVEVYPENIKQIKLTEQKILSEILILLHKRVSKKEIIEHFKISESEYSNYINQLFIEGLIKSSDGKEFVPACMIVASGDREDIKKYVEQFSNDIENIIIEKYQTVKEKYRQLNSFYNISFEESSLFILYNVLLDKWQKENIVEKFLRSDIPMRGSNQYYLMVNQEDTLQQSANKLWLENKYEDYKEYFLCVFGNISRRANYIDIKREQLIQDFGMSEVSNEIVFKKKIIDDLVKFMSGELKAADKNLTFPLNKYGLLKNSELILPVISNRENETLTQMALLISDELINYLDSKRPVFVKKYLSSVYKDEVSFREWTFWIYKFIAAEAASNLFDKGYIKKPSRELFYYLILK
ncbi:MAG: hypothetical protein KGZ42_10565 [Melioribacter sp.]|nr:hypothetical protein [Melioribacter sp.]